MARLDRRPGRIRRRRAVAHARAIGSRRCSTPARPAARSRASAPSSWSREVTDLYGAGAGADRSVDRGRGGARAGRRARRRRPGRQPAAGARPAPARRRDAGSRDALDSVRPYLGFARRRRRAARASTAGRGGPAAVRGQLQELPVVGGDARAGRRGRGARGRAGDRRSIEVVAARAGIGDRG